MKSRVQYYRKDIYHKSSEDSYVYQLDKLRIVYNDLRNVRDELSKLNHKFIVQLYKYSLFGADDINEIYFPIFYEYIRYYRRNIMDYKKFLFTNIHSLLERYKSDIRDEIETIEKRLGNPSNFTALVLQNSNYPNENFRPIYNFNPIYNPRNFHCEFKNPDYKRVNQKIELVENWIKSQLSSKVNDEMIKSHIPFVYRDGRLMVNSYLLDDFKSKIRHSNQLQILKILELLNSIHIREICYINIDSKRLGNLGGKIIDVYNNEIIAKVRSLKGANTLQKIESNLKKYTFQKLVDIEDQIFEFKQQLNKISLSTYRITNLNEIKNLYLQVFDILFQFELIKVAEKKYAENRLDYLFKSNPNQ